MQPKVKPLSLWRRKFVFGSLLLAFLVSLPVFMFYATGYRYDFTAKKPTFTATGAFYIVADTPDNEIYLDDELATNVRSFRNAFYLQGIEPGIHKVHVQAPLVHTWVKELPVVAHIVTEVSTFNLPLLPQVRLIPEYLSVNNVAVIFAKSSTTPVLSYIGTSTPFLMATTTATSTYRVNQEYSLLQTLFTEQASTTVARILQQEEIRNNNFGFSTSSKIDVVEDQFGTTTVAHDNVTLFERGGEVFALAEPTSFREVPYYFCTPTITEEDIVADATEAEIELEEMISKEENVAEENGTCREEIKIHSQGQTVVGFNFFPTNPNLVLLHLTDGVYVIEIDDRAWQNVQPLYLGRDLEMLIYRNGIFIKEQGLIFEVLPEILAV